MARAQYLPKVPGLEMNSCYACYVGTDHRRWRPSAAVYLLYNTLCRPLIDSRQLLAFTHPSFLAFSFHPQAHFVTLHRPAKQWTSLTPSKSEQSTPTTSCSNPNAPAAHPPQLKRFLETSIHSSLAPTPPNDVERIREDAGVEEE